MRSRLLIGTAALVVPLLAACGTSPRTGATVRTESPGVSSSTTATTTASPSPVAPSSQAVSTPEGPVLTGAAYAVTLPRKATIDATSPDWSRAWKLDLDGFGFGLSGQVMELDCGGCGANTPQTRRKLAREHVRHGRGTVLPDVTVNGVQLYHATSGGTASATTTTGRTTAGSSSSSCSSPRCPTARRGRSSLPR